MLEESSLLKEIKDLDNLCGELLERFTRLERVNNWGRIFDEKISNRPKPEDLLMRLNSLTRDIYAQALELTLGTDSLSVLVIDDSLLTKMQQAGFFRIADVLSLSIAELSGIEDLEENWLLVLINALIKAKYLPEGVTLAILRTEYPAWSLFEAGYHIKRHTAFRRQ